MTRAHHCEVPTIEGGEFGFVEAFGDGKDGGIDEADAAVRVAAGDFTDTRIVFSEQVCDLVCASGDVIEERDQYPGMHPLADQPINFHKYW